MEHRLSSADLSEIPCHALRRNMELATRASINRNQTSSIK